MIRHARPAESLLSLLVRLLAACLPACELTPHALGLVGGTAGVVREIIGDEDGLS